MLEFTDQMNRTIRLEKFPNRIVSLVPSQTELLYDLDLDDEVVGITKFCIHPEEWFRSKTRIGGTKSVNIEKVKGLNPDLIIANKEENTKEDVEQLMEIAPVWISDISTLNESLEMIRLLGGITNRESKANQLAGTISSRFNELKPIESDKSVLYFIWKNPDMVCGKETFVDEMLNYCGLRNTMIQPRYPEVHVTDEVPDVILLSSEPYPFKEKHIEMYQEIYPNADVRVVDGEMFSWYGSRLLKSPAYFQELIHQLEIPSDK